MEGNKRVAELKRNVLRFEIRLARAIAQGKKGDTADLQDAIRHCRREIRRIENGEA